MGKNRTLIAAVTYFGVVLAVFLAAGRGLEYRSIWQDEVETAERAKSIRASGLPRLIDPQGNWSINTGGHEVDTDDLHHYTPWFQFYVGAAGLTMGDLIGLSPDASIRLPFFFLHASTSGLVAALLPEVTGLSRLAAAAIATLYGVGTVRVINDRTARYHGLNDLLFFVAWILYGFVRRRLRSRGEARLPFFGLALTVSLLLHTHTLFGLLATGLFGALLLIEFPKDRRTYLFSLSLLPALVSLILLVRPQDQSTVWGGLAYRSGRSLKSWMETGYPFSFYFFSLFVIFSFFQARRGFWRENRREILIALAVPVFLWLGIRLLDFHPFSQPRYYLAIAGPLLFWPLAIGDSSIWKKRPARWFYGLSITGMLIAMELTSAFPPFHGLRLATFDAEAANESRNDPRQIQPLRLAFERLRELGKPGEGVLMEYVPQLVNWYLPEMKPALVPDDVALPSFARKNPLLEKIPFVEPTWHLYYYGVYEGYWVCAGGCDFTIHHDTGNPSSYRIHSKHLGRDFKFCVIAAWRTNHWNNAPFVSYVAEARSPSGSAYEDLVLAKRCD